MPLFLISLINVLVFFQVNDLGGKLAVIATLALAIIAFMPTANDKLPNTAKFKLMDLVVNSIILLLCLSMIDALIMFRQQPPAAVFSYSNGWFIVTVIANLAVLSLMLLLGIMYYCCWKPNYTKSS